VSKTNITICKKIKNYINTKSLSKKWVFFAG